MGKTLILLVSLLPSLCSGIKLHTRKINFFSLVAKYTISNWRAGNRGKSILFFPVTSLFPYYDALFLGFSIWSGNSNIQPALQAEIRTCFRHVLKKSFLNPSAKH